MIKTILIPFDFTPVSKNALDFAIDFIGIDSEIKILLAHITEEGMSAKLDDEFKAIKNEMGNFRGPFEWVVKNGHLGNALLEIQKTHKVDLVVMGTSGEQKLGELGNNTSKLAVAIDQCPVIAVPVVSSGFKLKKIALVLGRDKIQDRSVLETLLAITRRFNAKVVVLTVRNDEGAYGYSDEEEGNEKLLDYYLEGFYAHHAFIENTDIVAGVNEYVSANAIDMIAVLPLNHATGKKRSKGSLTKALAMHSQVPVLVID